MLILSPIVVLESLISYFPLNRLRAQTFHYSPIYTVTHAGSCLAFLSPPSTLVHAPSVPSSSHPVCHTTLFTGVTKPYVTPH